MKATVLFTGGKDSTYALHIAVIQGFDVVVLSTVFPLYKYSMLYHRPFYEILVDQAYSIGLPLETAGVFDEKQEIAALYTLLRRVKEKYGVEAVFSGAILSDFQRMRYSMVAEKLGLKSFTPLWRINQEKYLLELVDNGIEFILISINTLGLPMRFLGKVINSRDAVEIIKLSRRYGFNAAFEGGEAETLTVYSPLFKYRICYTGEKIVKSPYEGYFEIKKHWLGYSC